MVQLDENLFFYYILKLSYNAILLIIDKMTQQINICNFIFKAET